MNNDLVFGQVLDNLPPKLKESRVCKASVIFVISASGSEAGSVVAIVMTITHTCRCTCTYTWCEPDRAVLVGLGAPGCLN